MDKIRLKKVLPLSMIRRLKPEKRHILEKLLQITSIKIPFLDEKDQETRYPLIELTLDEEEYEFLKEHKNHSLKDYQTVLEVKKMYRILNISEMDTLSDPFIEFIICRKSQADLKRLGIICDHEISQTIQGCLSGYTRVRSSLGKRLMCIQRFQTQYLRNFYHKKGAILDVVVDKIRAVGLVNPTDLPIRNTLTSLKDSCDNAMNQVHSTQRHRMIRTLHHVISTVERIYETSHLLHFVRKSDSEWPTISSVRYGHTCTKKAQKFKKELQLNETEDVKDYGNYCVVCVEKLIILFHRWTYAVFFGSDTEYTLDEILLRFTGYLAKNPLDIKNRVLPIRVNKGPGSRFFRQVKKKHMKFMKYSGKYRACVYCPVPDDNGWYDFVK